MREEDAVYILPPHLELRETLQSAAACVEEELLAQNDA